MYAIVDIETTGGNSKWARITEIAVCLHNGKYVEETFHSHINPEQDIPLQITRLTGISNETVENAPKFREIADELYAFLKPHIFVAHNVSFDYSFVKESFSREGMAFEAKRLCTVRLSRKILAGHLSYSLGNLCKTLGIEIEGRHTALGDAMATAELFSMLARNDHEDFINTSLKKSSKEGGLPPHLDKSVIEQLPEAMGIYYFLNQKEEALYIGKSKNIKKRILGHLSSSSPTREKSRFIKQIHKISYKLCPNTLYTDLLECHEIKSRWPAFNIEYKKRSQGYGIYTYTDQRGFAHFHISKLLAKSKPLHVFSDYISAYNYMKDKASTFDLCPNLCGLTTHNVCTLSQELNCQKECPKQAEITQYRAKAKLALQEIGIEKKSFVIVNDGFSSEEKTLVYVEKGTYKGLGICDNSTIINEENIQNLIQPYKTNLDIQNIILKHLEQKNYKELLHFEFQESKAPSLFENE